MSEWMKQMLESKRRYRTKLASLPFAEKVEILEKLRQRGLAIRATRLTKATR